MKHSLAAVAVVLLAVFMMSTGFQCGSADVTSAKLYESRQDYEKAEASYLKEVTKNPNNHEAWYLLGRIRAQRADYKGMKEAFDKSLAIKPEFAKEIGEATKFGWSKTLNEGVGNYNRSITASKDSATALREKAIECYKTALLLNPDSVVTYQNLAYCYHADGRYDDEIGALKEAARKKPTSEIYTLVINAYLQKGQAAEERGNKAEAADNFDQAILAINEARKTDPANEELLGTMINLYLRMNRAAEAKPHIYEVLAKDPTNKIYQYDLGVLLMQTDSLTAAIPHFEAALSVDPKYDLALQNIAITYMKLGDKTRKATQGSDPKKNTDKTFVEQFKKAAGYFERLTEVKPDNADIWESLGSAYANANMGKQAQAALIKADALRKK
jgi:tetratricopeptide (TPR) repeat protein